MEPEGEAGIATIHDLARLAGVSVSTVSRALNNYPDVKDETRQRVLRLARELNYRPSAAARTLVTQRSYVIGLIMFFHPKNPDLLHPFFQEVVVGFKRRVGLAGYDLLLFANEAPDSALGGMSWVSRCRHHRVDGVALMGAHGRDAAIQELANSDLPCMVVDLDMAGKRTGYVMSDNINGAVLAVRHLHGLGHRRIAHIAGLTDSRPGIDRLVGYRNELEHLGLPYHPEYVQVGDFYLESGYEAMGRLLDLPELPSAVFAASDLMAIGAINAIQDRGLRVPEDVAVLGFDDIQVAPLIRPALTTVAQDKQALGEVAGEALVRLIDDPSMVPPVITMPVRLIERESCGAQGRADRM